MSEQLAKEGSQGSVKLNLKSKSSEEINKKIISQQKREISRLQNLIAKMEVRHQSDVAKVRAAEFEKYRKKHLQITSETSPQEAARIYAEIVRYSEQ